MGGTPQGAAPAADRARATLEIGNAQGTSVTETEQVTPATG